LGVGDLNAAVGFSVKLYRALRMPCVSDGVFDGEKVSPDEVFLNLGAESHLKEIMWHGRIASLADWHTNWQRLKVVSLPRCSA
jgi:hypothetical protein